MIPTANGRHIEAPLTPRRPSYHTERRATLLTVENPVVTLTITPTTPCVHPVFELHDAPKTLSRVELNERELTATDYAWDGRVFWLNATLRKQAQLRLQFAAH